MIKEILPLLDEKVYKYDGNDNLVSFTDEEGQKTTVRYDLNNQPTAMTYSDGRTAVKDGEAIPTKAVYVRNRNKRKESLCLISTDITLDENEIIRIYGIQEHAQRQHGTV